MLQIIWQAEYGQTIEEIRNNYELSVWRPEGSRIIWRPSIDKWMILKYAFKIQLWIMNLKAKDTIYCLAFVNNSQLFKEEYKVWS
jgi:hypothetical protein